MKVSDGGRMPRAGPLKHESNGILFLGFLELQPMVSGDFSRARLDTTVDLCHPLAVLARRLPCDAAQFRRFCCAIAGEGLEQLLKTTVGTAVEIKVRISANVTGDFGNVTDLRLGAGLRG